MFRKFTPTTSRCQTRRSFILKGYDMRAFSTLFLYTLTVISSTLLYSTGVFTEELFMALVLCGVASGMLGVSFTLMYKILTAKGEENEYTN